MIGKIKYALTVMFALLFFIPFQAYADDNFIITDYDVNITVNEDDTYVVEETIDVTFTAASHGIYRTIPSRATVKRDGKTSKYDVTVSDFDVTSGQYCKETKQNGNYIFRIGDPDVYEEDKTTYRLSYTYDPGGDHLKDVDEFYYNIIGAVWEAQDIRHVSFSITFPKEIDVENVGIKTGNGTYIPFEVYGNQLKGETDENVLKGLTIRAVLPEGYFTRQTETGFDRSFLLMILVSLITLILGVVLWLKGGIDPPIVETVEFYPPKKLTSAEVGFLYDGEIKNRHILSILLSLADKGYIKIIEDSPRKNTDYTILKLKEYDGYAIGERAFMEGLFEGRSNRVSMSELKDEFYETVDSIKTRIKNKYGGNLYDVSAQMFANALYMIAIAGYVIVTLLMVAKAVLSDSSAFEIPSYIYIMFILQMFGFHIIRTDVKRMGANGKRSSPVITVPIITAVVVGMVTLGYFLTGMFSVSQTVSYMFCLLVSCTLAVLSGLCEKRTELYSDLLGKIRGYRNFLETTEKSRIKMLVNKDPEYFYRMLAYAYSLDITDEYIKNFEPIVKEPPKWFVTADRGYGMRGFNHSLNGAMLHMNSCSAAPKKDSSSHGGSFSGGGGFGGGGGGSW